METTGSYGNVTVIIPSWNGLKWLPNCLESLKNQDYANFEIILVDDASTDGSPDFTETHYPGVKILKRIKRGGFARAVNDGIAIASGDYIILLNNDTIASSSLIKILVNAIGKMPPDIGSLACSMRNMGEPALIDDAGDILTWYGQALKRGHGKSATEYSNQGDVFSACAGAALYRRSFFEDIGYFDERFVCYLEDIDLGLRGQLNGYRCVYMPDALILHQGHGSAIHHRNYIRLMTRNCLLLFGKNIPFTLLMRHLPEIVLGQLVFFIRYRQPWDSIIGYLSLLPEIPHTIRERHRILTNKVLKENEIEMLLLDTAVGISFPGWLSVKSVRKS